MVNVVLNGQAMSKDLSNKLEQQLRAQRDHISRLDPPVKHAAPESPEEMDEGSTGSYESDDERPADKKGNLKTPRRRDLVVSLSLLVAKH